MLEQIIAIFVTLFVIIDPIGTVPLFISLTSRHSESERRQIAARAVLVSAGVLCFFIVLGKVLFDSLNVRLVSFEIAGGILLFLFGLKMVFDKPEGAGMHAEPEHDVAIFPLAIPAIAGPGAMLGVVVCANSPEPSPLRMSLTLAILLVVLLITFVMIRLSAAIQRWIGDTGALILSRVLGIMLTAIATETILKALAKLSYIQ